MQETATAAVAARAGTDCLLGPACRGQRTRAVARRRRKRSHPSLESTESTGPAARHNVPATVHLPGPGTSWTSSTARIPDLAILAAPREVTTSAGAVPVLAPRVNDRRTDEATGERRRFASAILPAWSRKSPRVAEVLPLLYLHGLSTSDFATALVQFLGSGAGLSPTTINRLTTGWQQEAAAFNKRPLVDTDYVYCWVDGIHLKVRLEQDKVCLLVMIGVRGRWPQGADRARRRLPRVDRLVG